MKKLMTFVIPFIFALCLVGCSKASSSIGIIGGADGPTEVFVSSGMSQMGIFGLIGVIVAVAIVVFLICRNRKKK